jgi:hypothetical protein
MGRQAVYRQSLMVVLIMVVSAGVALALEAGDQAPDFTLPSTTGAKISLSQFRGKKHVLNQRALRMRQLTAGFHGAERLQSPAVAGVGLGRWL